MRFNNFHFINIRARYSLAKLFKNLRTLLFSPKSILFFLLKFQTIISNQSNLAIFIAFYKFLLLALLIDYYLLIAFLLYKFLYAFQIRQRVVKFLQGINNYCHFYYVLLLEIKIFSLIVDKLF